MYSFGGERLIVASIGEDYRAVLNLIQNGSLQGLPVDLWHHSGANLALFTIQHAPYGSLN
jgi:hypothetical protein